MSSYGEEQWEFLLGAGHVDALVAPSPDNNDLLGCVLRIDYGPHDAFGMMLVSKDARGQGLAKKLLNSAMTKGSSGMKILGTCTEMGRPMYEKMGFQRVGTVTRMSIATEKLAISKDSTVKLHMNEASHLPALLALDQKATGLDRSATLKAIHGYPYVKMATITAGEDDEVVTAALVTQHSNSPLATVGPILGNDAYVTTLLQGIKEAMSSVKDLAVMISDHPELVQKLAKQGFETVFELGAMTMDGVPLPGERNQYIGLIHPTLG